MSFAVMYYSKVSPVPVNSLVNISSTRLLISSVSISFHPPTMPTNNYKEIHMHVYAYVKSLIYEGQLSVTGESTCMCTEYWLPLMRSKPAHEKCG